MSLKTCASEDAQLLVSMSGGVFSAIGHTPLIELTRVLPGLHFRLFAKMEGLNPGGSIKDRTAHNILRRGIESGAIRPWTVVIESSSGNMGIGLAQACAYLGLRFVCVVDPKTTQQNIDILKAYGAEVDMVTRPDPATKEYLPVRLERVRELLGRDPNNFWPAQYSNPDNPAAHYSTMREVEAALGGRLDYVFCATSTCGTLRGCAEYVREHDRATRVYAVDAVGSVIFGSEKAKRLIPGHGAAVIPELFQTDLTDHVVHVTDLDCVAGCRRLVRREGILAGGSSGGVLRAVELSKDAIAPGSTCVAILADRGERYLDTIYSDTWVEANFGHVSHLWTHTNEA